MHDVVIGLFSARGRSSSSGTPHHRSALTTRERDALPARFDVVGEALVAGASPLDACRAIGRELARDGASLEESLAGLRTTWRLLRGDDPEYDAIAALLGAWSETTLSFVNHITCEDPMTGLASLAHLRSSVSALFREHHQGEDHPRDSHALVVVDLPRDRHGGGRRDHTDVMGRALRVARLGEAVRTVFPGGDVIGRVSSNRVAVLAPRESRLGVRVRLLRRLVDGLELGGHGPRVWIEGLPATDLGCGLLLDELARP